MFDKKMLGKRIKEIRKNKGLTQEHLSEKLGIDSKHLSRIECGVNQPSLDLINKIAIELAIPPYLLFQSFQYRSKKELINDINTVLQNSSEEKVQMFYKVLMDITS